MNRMAQSVDLNISNNMLYPKFNLNQDYIDPKTRPRRDTSPIIGLYSPESLPISDIFVGGGIAFSAQEQTLDEILQPGGPEILLTEDDVSH